MMILVKWFLNAFSLWIVAQFVPGVRLDGFGSALIAVVIIGLVNVFIAPLLVFLTLPINILTLGLFTFILNAFLLMIAAALAPGFQVDGLLSAILGSIVLSLVSTALYMLLSKRR